MKTMTHLRIEYLILIFGLIQCSGTLTVTLSPAINQVLVNQSVTLTCSSNGNATGSTSSCSRWTITQSYVTPVICNIDGKCQAYGYLKDEDIYSWSCNESNTFSLTIRRVTIQDHNQTWRCHQEFSVSNLALILVYVPVESVTIEVPRGEILHVKENTAVTLTCISSYSRPASNVTWWFKNNVTEEISNVFSRTKVTLSADNRGLTSTTSELEFTANRSVNSLKVFCSSTNLKGYDVRSDSILLNVSYPPSIPPEVMGFRNGSIYNLLENSTGQLSCSIAGGNPPARLTWDCYNEGVSVVNGSEVVSTLTWVALRDQGRVCVCRAYHDTWHSAEIVNVEILYPPEVLNLTLEYQPGMTIIVKKHVRVIENRSIVLTCMAYGKPKPFQYTWSGLSTSQTKSVTLQNVQRSHAGTFTCHAHNLMQPSSGREYAGKGIESVVLEILYPPDVDNMENRSVIEGTALNVSCPLLPGNPKHTRFKWENDKDNTEWHSQFLTINNVTRRHHGVYRCTVYNDMVPDGDESSEGRNSRLFQMNVFYEANVQKFFIDDHDGQRTVTITENENVRFTCSVDSNPVSTIKLNFQGKTNIHKEYKSKTLTFLRKNVSYFDAGVYTCTASNRYNHGLVSLDVVVLLVKCSPKLHPEADSTSMITVAKGSPATFSIATLAYPEPGPSGFIWKKHSGSDWITLTQNERIKISSSELTSNLTISHVTAFDYGNYKLIITNDVGQLERHIDLKEGNHPNLQRGTLPIAGIVLGSIVPLLAISTVLAIVIVRFRRKLRKKRNSDYEMTTTARAYDGLNTENQTKESTEKAYDEVQLDRGHSQCPVKFGIVIENIVPFPLLEWVCNN